MKLTAKHYRKAAERMFHNEGTIEIDDNAKVSTPVIDGDDGRYVQAWVWVPTADVTKADTAP